VCAVPQYNGSVDLKVNREKKSRFEKSTGTSKFQFYNLKKKKEEEG